MLVDGAAFSRLIVPLFVYIAAKATLMSPQFLELLKTERSFVSSLPQK